MSSFLSKVLFPAAVVALTAFHTIGPNTGVSHTYTFVADSAAPDTVVYPRNGFKKGWTKEDFDLATKATDSLDMPADTALALSDIEVVPVALRPAALDSIKAPDSLRHTDPFLYRYYAAVKDSSCHIWVRDSLLSAGDTISRHTVDSLYAADSLIIAKEKFAIWYAGLDKKARKNYDREQSMPLRQARLDSLKEAKDSIKAYKDSVHESVPRVLETFVFDDSLYYKRLLEWKHERHFHSTTVHEHDTSYNYYFNDYPFLRKDVNATWLGVAGSPVQSYNFFQRKYNEGVSFYENLESWSYNPETMPYYNSKTPYTELAYYGTLFANQSKASDNIHILTTQNINPAANFALEFNRFGGSGILTNERTANKTFSATANYLGKKYLMHTGYIYNMVSRNENGGILDNSWIRDTTVDAREIGVALSKASSMIRKNTVFLDQQYRIPFYFLAPKSESDTTWFDENDITTAFIGHSSELSVYRRKYEDSMTNQVEKDFYNNVFNMNPITSADSMRVFRFDNRFFMRLQPWKEDGVVSKLDVGIGEKLMKYYVPDPTFLYSTSNKNWNATYLYAGAEGQIGRGIHWDALGDYVLLGNEANDLSLKANASMAFYPFRKARKSPVSLNAHFETTLDEPEYYQQHLFMNHFKWDNDFKKISTTKIEGELSIPYWKFSAKVGYALLADNLYYDANSIIRQNSTAMSVLSAAVKKDFVIANFLHLDHNLLFQVSSNQDVLPLPTLAGNLRYYIQFNVKPKVMAMQIGVNGWYTTKWYMPGWNPEVGTFYNQNELEYGNCPYFDAFVNVQWKRACIFVKLENAGQGWPMDKADYFSAHHFIRTQRAAKFGIFWPFYTQPAKEKGLMGEHRH